MDPRFLENLWIALVCNGMVMYLNFNEACALKFETKMSHGKKNKFDFKLIL